MYPTDPINKLDLTGEVAKSKALGGSKKSGTGKAPSSGAASTQKVVGTAIVAYVATVVRVTATVGCAVTAHESCIPYSAFAGAAAGGLESGAAALFNGSNQAAAREAYLAGAYEGSGMGLASGLLAVGVGRIVRTWLLVSAKEALFTAARWASVPFFVPIHVPDFVVPPDPSLLAA